MFFLCVCDILYIISFFNDNNYIYIYIFLCFQLVFDVWDCYIYMCVFCRMCLNFFVFSSLFLPKAYDMVFCVFVAFLGVSDLSFQFVVVFSNFVLSSFFGWICFVEVWSFFLNCWIDFLEGLFLFFSFRFLLKG